MTLLHALILEQALGIDRAAQESQTYLRYVKDNVTQVMAVSEAGEVMPQKSTYFYPKIASGIVLNPLDPAESVSPKEAR